MSWLRIDDGFSRHPKVTSLTPRERWVWMDMLCYCARYRTGGYLPDNPAEVISGATSKFLARCGQLGLLNVQGKRLRVHDWHVYNGTVEERVEHFLGENPDATANDIHKAVGGNRDHVLAEVKRHRPAGTDGTTQAGTTRTTSAGSETGTESGSRARVPNPSLTPIGVTELQALPNHETPQDGHEEQLWKRLCIAAGARNQPDIQKLERTVRARKSTDREIHCAIDAATGPGVKDPLAVAISELVKRHLERTAA